MNTRDVKWSNDDTNFVTDAMILKTEITKQIIVCSNKKTLKIETENSNK